MVVGVIEFKNTTAHFGAQSLLLCWSLLDWVISAGWFFD
jgi:hypothetical protein